MGELLLVGMKTAEAVQAVERFGVTVLEARFDVARCGAALLVVMDTAAANAVALALADVSMRYAECPAVDEMTAS